MRSDAPAQRGDRVSHVALRALGSRVARSPRVSQMCRGSQRFFFTASLNEALSNEEAVSGNA